VKFRLDARFLWFAVAVTVLTTLLSGVAPALRALRTDVRDVLADAGGKSSLSGGRRRSLNFLVIGEVAIALVVLVAGGLILEAFYSVTSRDPGFRADNVLTMAIDPPEGTSEQRFQICQQLLTRLRSSPGVDTAGAIDYLPLGPGVMQRGDWVGWGIQRCMFDCVQSLRINCRSKLERRPRLSLETLSEPASREPRFVVILR
jgi:hypothetical protein